MYVYICMLMYELSSRRISYPMSIDEFTWYTV